MAITLLFASFSYADNWSQTHCPANGNIISFATSGSNLFAGISSGGIYATTDNGATWAEADAGIPTNTTVNALVSYGSNIFAGTYGSGVYLSSSGSTWAAVNTGLPTNATVTALFINGSYVYAGTYGSGMYVSANNGTSWSSVNNGLSASSTVNSITATNSSLFVATQNGVYRSNDNGSTWTAANYGLPSGATVHVIIANGSVIYAGTNGSGIYYSIDNGTTWTAFNNGLQGNTNILSMAVSGAEILAGTVGSVFHNNNGSTWQVVNTGLSSIYNVYSLVVNGNDLFAGTNNGVWESPLPPPTLTYFVPANNATNQPDSLTLTWNSITTATSYAIQISTDSTFTTSLVSSVGALTTNTYLATGLTNNTVYFWHVNAGNDGGTSAWSGAIKFTTTILAPTSVSPVNNSTNQPTALNLQWNSVSTATSYSLQVGTDSTFASSIIYSQSGLTSTTQAVSGLANNTVYFWRINATNQGGTSPWSTGSRFSTIVAIPTSPIPIMPANAATGQPLSVVIGWNPVSGASSYNLQVSTDSTFSNSVIYSQNNLTTASQTINSLANTTVYFWRVSATNMVGTGPWSTPNRFTTIVGTPTPVSPINAPVNQPVSLTVAWGAVASATSYSLQVSTDSTFAAASFYSQNGSTTSQTVSGMNNGVTYFWRVNATNNGGTGAWSAVNRFTTIIAVPTVPVLVSPSNFATGLPVSMPLSWNAVTSATYYNLQVSTDSTFASSIIYNQNNLTGTSQNVGGLANNTVYYWRVNAANVTSTGPWSYVNRFTTVVGTPTLAAPATGSINEPVTLALSWNPVASATSYSLQVSSDSTFTGPLFYSQSGLPSTSQTVSAMANNTTYYWRVNAMNAGGTSAWSTKNTFSTIIAIPLTPTLVAPINTAANQPVTLSLSWNAVAAATSYALQVSTDPTFATSIIYSQTGIAATMLSVSGLANNTSYYWHVKATNLAGSSGWSPSNAFTTILTTPTLEAPLNTATGQPLTMTVRWDPVASASTYSLQVSTDSTFSATSFYNQNGLTSITQTISNLANNTVYYWRVNASNPNGTSMWTSPFHFATTLAGPTLVSPPNNATNQPVVNKLSWNAVPTAISYTLQVSADSSFSSSLAYNQSGLTTTSQTVSGLANSTVYYWRVNATNSGSTSSWSGAGAFTTALIAPTLASPSNSATTQSTTLAFAWNQVSSATSYALQISTTSAFTAPIYNQSGLTSMTQIVSGLSNSTTYYWRVNATNAGSTSGWSSTYSFSTVISTTSIPSLLTPVNYATSQPIVLSVTWNAVTGASSYTLQVSSDSTFTNSFACNQSGLTKTNLSISGLSNNTVYYWRVNATNAGGTSVWSTPYQFTTIILAPSQISPAANAINQPVSLDMTWSPVSMATSYALQVAADSNFVTKIAFSQSGLTATTQTVTGLSNNTIYYWRVSANNPLGTSAWSLKYRFTTIIVLPAVPLLSQPVNNAVNQPVSLTMSWGAIAGATSYALQVSTDSTFTSSVIFNQSGLTVTSQAITGLTTNTVFYWRVNATNLAGIGTWSNCSRFTTVLAAPILVAPLNSAVNQPVSLSLSWNPVDAAISYGLQVSTDSSFKTSLVFNQNGISTTSQTVSGLTNNKTYYWHVYAINSSGVSSWSAKNAFTTIITAPTIATPANGATNQPNTLKLTWNAVASAISYNLQVSTDPTFATSVVYSQSGISTPSQTVSGLGNTMTYYWHVSASNASGGISAWSSTGFFITLSSAPTLISPISSVLQSATFQWDTVPGTNSYALQVSTDSTFATAVIYNQSGITTTSQLVSNLASGVIYYWHVNATNSNGTSPWSPPSSFSTICAAPTLVAPVNNASTLAIPPTLSWTPKATAKAYALQVSVDSTFDTAFLFSVSATSQVVSGLSNNTSYYWRVNVTNAGGTSAWSSRYRFTTVVAAPTSPRLNGTSSGSANHTISLILTWDTVTNASSYTLQIATDSLFGTVVYNQSGLTGTSQTVSGLASNATYYWRVSAVNAGGASAWSLTNYFKVQGSKVLPTRQASMPTAFDLGDARVNPSGVMISFAVPPASEAGKAQRVVIKLYDIQGHYVASVLNDFVAAGYQIVPFNGRNSAGQVLARGLYVCTMNAPGFMKAKVLKIVR
jgi:hypothetical protein